jgi:hypothetical protein
VTDKEVKKGTQATLTCSLTGLGGSVGIAWFDGATAVDGQSGEYSKWKLLGYDVFKSMILRDECLILSLF